MLQYLLYVRATTYPLKYKVVEMITEIYTLNKQQTIYQQMARLLVCHFWLFKRQNKKKYWLPIGSPLTRVHQKKEG